MATDFTWEKLKEKYPPGSKVKQLSTSLHTSTTELTVLNVDDEYLYFKWGVVRNGKVSRCNLERMAELVADGVIKQELSTLVNDYRTIISDERPTTACAILVDMGVIKLEDV